MQKSKKKLKIKKTESDKLKSNYDYNCDSCSGYKSQAILSSN